MGRHLLAAAAWLALAAPAAATEPTLVSEFEAGGGVARPAVSAGGRYVVYEHEGQVVRRDMLEAAVELVSRGFDGEPADDDITSAIALDVSADGRYVLFGSTSTNIVDGATGPDEDDEYLTAVFVRDMRTGTTRVASRASGAAGAFADGRTTAAELSDDGRVVAFLSFATNLGSEIPEETSAALYVRDMETNRIEVASRRSGRDGAIALDVLEDDLSISGDGSLVAFSTGDQLVPGDGDQQHDVYLRDLAGDRTLLGSDAGPAGDVYAPALSRTGDVIGFSEMPSFDAVPEPAVGIWMRDRAAARTLRAGTAQRLLGIDPDGDRLIVFDATTTGPALLQAPWPAVSGLPLAGAVSQQATVDLRLAPDGRFAVFTARRDTFASTYLVALPRPPSAPAEDPAATTDPAAGTLSVPAQRLRLRGRRLTVRLRWTGATIRRGVLRLRRTTGRRIAERRFTRLPRGRLTLTLSARAVRSLRRTGRIVVVAAVDGVVAKRTLRLGR